MRHLVSSIITVLGLTLAIVPAHAVNVPGCFGGEFLVFAGDDIVFENSAGAHTILTGDFIVAATSGKVKVGSFNEIHGTISAHQITINNGAVVDKCIANVLILSGSGACLDVTQVGPGQFAPPAACAFPPLPVPTIPDCVKTGTAVTVGTPAVPSLAATLPPGCYGALRVNKGSALTLDPGGVYDFRTVTLISGSTLAGADAGNRSVVNTLGTFSTDNGNVTLRNLFVTSLSKGATLIRNNSLVDNSVIFAPFGNLHPNTGTQLTGDTELVGLVFHDIQPITNTPPPTQIPCVCPFPSILKPGASDLICILP